MEKYVFVREIGSGSFGKVFLTKSKQKGINYVVKQVDLNKLDRKHSQSAKKEVLILAKLRHNNIVSYKESYEKNNQLNIVLEYCENGDLHEKIKEKRMSRKFFGENEILDYFVQICLALEYIHDQRILHRDLKTKNIFLTKGNVIKLGDFGIAKTLENSFELAQTCIGSPFYISPEICESKPYNKKSDIWALGCVLYELATLRYAFVAKNVKTLLTKILTGEYNPLPVTMNIHIRGLISAMLKPNPKDRPSVKEILGKRFLIKKRAVFICKAHKSDLERERSKSVDVGRSLRGVANNNSCKQSFPKQAAHLKSCFQLNQLNEQKQSNVYLNLKAIYSASCSNQNVKFAEKKVLLENSQKNETEELKRSSINHRTESKTKKSLKLTRIDSEYYDLIAGDRKNDSQETKEKISYKPASGDEFKLGMKKEVSQLGMSEAVEEKKVEGFGFSVTSELDGEKSCEQQNEIDAGNERRKKWLKSTLEKKALLELLSGSELLDDTLPLEKQKEQSESPPSKLSIDDMLCSEPLEVSNEILIPVKIYDDEKDKENPINNCLQRLRHEVDQLREKFQVNNGTYQIEDLLKLTANSKEILSVGAAYPENGWKVGESVFYSLECKKLALEKKVGFVEFLTTREKMLNIIHDDFESNLKRDSEIQIDGTKTYTIPEIGDSIDGDNVVKNTWKSIIVILGEKQECLPDIWELAVSESIHYCG